MTPRQYNSVQLASGDLTLDHLTELVRQFQSERFLTVDGMCGPKTRAELDRAAGPLRVSTTAWLLGPNVEHIQAHPSWYGAPMPRGPLAIMAHYTATDYGTARSLATRRTDPRTSDKRAASWHVTIAHDGAIYQMVPLDHCAWHCARGQIDGLGVNQAAIGIELEGDGQSFTNEQIAAARDVWRAIVRVYGIPRDRAVLEHSRFDPGRRSDPGPVFMSKHAEWIRVSAYA